MTPKTNIPVRMTEEDGNAFSILGRCRQALRRAGRMDLWPPFHQEATSGNYDHLLCTVMEYFLVDPDEDDMNGSSEDYE